MKVIRKTISIGVKAALLFLNLVSTVSSNDRINMPLEEFGIVATRTYDVPVLDGFVNDECWLDAVELTAFTQFTPAQELPATERTFCYFLYDDTCLYFGARCLESNPSAIFANVNSRDEIIADDWIMLMLDTYGDMRSAYEFVVNPYGIQADLIQYGDYDSFSWDAVWRSKGQITNDGWQVEIAIPFKILRFSGQENQNWRFQIIRRINHNGEMSFYVPMRKVDNNLLARTAELRGMKGIGYAQQFSFIPYTTSLVDKETDYSFEEELGLDVKYTMKSNMVLDFTYNPDFGHIEADVDEINLTPYELYLIEKRPFFLEKMDVFETPFNLFYSRRVNDPKTGLKLTGKLKKIGVGALYLIDERPGSIPDNKYGAIRLTGDFLKQSKIGVLFVANQHTQFYNRLGALDLKIIQGSFTIISQVARSWTTDIENLSWLSYTSFSYYRNNVSLEYSHRIGEKNFRADAGYVLPIYIARDLQPVSYRRDRLSSSYTLQTNKQFLRRLMPEITLSKLSTYDHKSISKNVSLGLSAELPRNLILVIAYDKNRLLWEDRYFNESSLQFGFALNPNKFVSVSSFYSEGQALDYWNVATVWQKSLSFELELKPTPRVEIAPLIYYVSQFEDRGGRQTLNQTVGLLRLTYGFSSDLFFKSFLQYNSGIEYYTFNLLLGYTFLPGSTFYLAYNSMFRSVDNSLNKQSEIIFGKLSYLIDI